RNLASGKSAAHPEAERDSRVDVAAGDWTNRIHHREKREAECECDTQSSNFVPGQYRRTYAYEHQHKGTDKLSKIPFHTYERAIGVPGRFPRRQLGYFAEAVENL